jgi:1,4-alpha-glucan branching enzyme
LSQNPSPSSAPPALAANAFLSLTLHAHLPWVIHNGTWPHGTEWLYDAAAETYLPLLRILANLERDGLALHCNLSLSPILLEQFAHPTFRSEFPGYLGRKIGAAREDEAYFRQSGDQHLAYLARYWQHFFTQALEDFNALDRDLIAGFRRFQSAGLISLITSCATHSYLPLLGTDESVLAQVRTGIAAHRRHLGSAPRGLWSPECGYRPAGLWQYPVAPEGSPAPPAFDRIGVEQALSASGIDFFFADTHLIQNPAQNPARATSPARSLYHPLHVDPGGDKPPTVPKSRFPPITVFPRDPQTAAQVWSAENGYPGDPSYLDFHKKRFPGGHRYWKVTGDPVDITGKHPYDPQQAAERVREHARHFVQLVAGTLADTLADTLTADLAAASAKTSRSPRPTRSTPTPPILCALFDADLFGHWWFEGPQWLEAVVRAVRDHNDAASDHNNAVSDHSSSSSDHTNASGTHKKASLTRLELIDCTRYLQLAPPTGHIALREGSWGAGGDNQVWINPATAWTWSHIYAAELTTRTLATQGHWRGDLLGTRILAQLCRELLLLESSDWQFLITTGGARDYAERRFNTHNRQFLELKDLYAVWQTAHALTEAQHERLAEIERRDSIFPDLDPTLWIEASPAAP